MLTATLFVAISCIVAPENTATAPVLPFSAEENIDGARGVWFFMNISGLSRPYEVCRDIPKSIYYSEVKTPQAGDVFWWPDFMALYNPKNTDGNDLMTLGGVRSSKDLVKKYGPLRIFRAEVDDSVGPGEVAVDAFGQRVVCKNPNPKVWLEEERKVEPEMGRGIVLFKHFPIDEAQHTGVQPVISLVFQKFPGAPPSLKDYANKVTNSAKDVSIDTTEEESGGLLCRLHYTSGNVGHKVVMLCRIKESVGFRLMVDSTEVSYAKVEQDFIAFLSSLSITTPKK